MENTSSSLSGGEKDFVDVMFETNNTDIFYEYFEKLIIYASLLQAEYLQSPESEIKTIIEKLAGRSIDIDTTQDLSESITEKIPSKDQLIKFFTNLTSRLSSVLIEFANGDYEKGEEKLEIFYTIVDSFESHDNITECFKHLLWNIRNTGEYNVLLKNFTSTLDLLLLLRPNHEVLSCKGFEVFSELLKEALEEMLIVENFQFANQYYSDLNRFLDYIFTLDFNNLRDEDYSGIFNLLSHVSLLSVHKELIYLLSAEELTLELRDLEQPRVLALQRRIFLILANTPIPGEIKDANNVILILSRYVLRLTSTNIISLINIPVQNFLNSERNEEYGSSVLVLDWFIGLNPILKIKFENGESLLNFFKKIIEAEANYGYVGDFIEGDVPDDLDKVEPTEYTIKGLEHYTKTNIIDIMEFLDFNIELFDAVAEGFSVFIDRSRQAIIQVIKDFFSPRPEITDLAQDSMDSVISKVDIFTYIEESDLENLATDIIKQYDFLDINTDQLINIRSLMLPRIKELLEMNANLMEIPKKGFDQNKVKLEIKNHFSIKEERAIMLRTDFEKIVNLIGSMVNVTFEYLIKKLKSSRSIIEFRQAIDPDFDEENSSQNDLIDTLVNIGKNIREIDSSINMNTIISICFCMRVVTSKQFEVVSKDFASFVYENLDDIYHLTIKGLEK